jgi:hypothetical protein
MIVSSHNNPTTSSHPKEQSWRQRTQQAVRRALLQLSVLALLVLATLVLTNAQSTQASAGRMFINPLQSPPPQPIMLTLDCQKGWNPSCRTSATGTPGVRLYSYFYIDNRYRGSATLTYTNVCRRFYLADGSHSAKVYARDARGRTATVGPIAGAIRCDRTRPTVAARYRHALWHCNASVSGRQRGAHLEGAH